MCLRLHSTCNSLAVIRQHCWPDLRGIDAVQITGTDLSCGHPGESTSDQDCDVAAPEVYPGALEVVADGVDQDCAGADTCFEDLDLDDFGSPLTVVGQNLSCAFDGEATVELPSKGQG